MLILFLGSIALRVENSDNITNTCLVVDRNGEIVCRYDKIYMYTVDKPNLKIDEASDTVAGSKLGLVELDGVKLVLVFALILDTLNILKLYLLVALKLCSCLLVLGRLLVL